MIVLIGFMGAGKTTVGQELARLLGRDFLDSDQVIEERSGRWIRDIFAQDGEAAFRELEAATIADLLAGPDAVLALGGGAVQHPGTRALLADHDVVLLRIGLAAALVRLADDPARPMLQRDDLAQVFADRQPAYEQVATVTVDTEGHTPQDSVEAVLSALRLDVQPLRPRTGPGGESARQPVCVFVGPSGAGKSTVAHLVGERLGLPVVEVDRIVERLAGKPVSDIFIDDGEAAYRELELRASMEALGRLDHLVELPGGAVLAPQVASALAEQRVVFLDVGVADAAKRIGFGATPAMVMLNPRRTWLAHMQTRRPAYQAVATWSVDTADRSPQDIADEVAGLLTGEGA